MAQVLVENVPTSFQKRFGKTIDFQNLIGIYWDGMDWCQYDEVLVSTADMTAQKNYKKDISKTSGKDFLTSLIK